MRITFLMPGYSWAPSGGFRVVYEYANRLASRGHVISIVQPRRLNYDHSDDRSVYAVLRRTLFNGRAAIAKPTMRWHPLDSRVRLVFTRDSDSGSLPDGDILFATSWQTVRSVLECSETKGHKCYLIQGYETYHASKTAIEATWQAPLHKIVISKWLADLGRDLGCQDLHYIPNGIDHSRYRIATPIEGRRRQAAMLFSSSPVKGADDGIEALRIAKQRFRDLDIVLFGVSRGTRSIPSWAKYYRNPKQGFIINHVYSKSQIFVHSSWMEGFGLPPAEAGACGCALAATDSLGVREFITHGKTGLLSPPRDPAALAENICLLLEDERMRTHLAQAASESIGRLSWDRSTDLFETFVMNVADGKGCASTPAVERRSPVA